MEKVNTSMSMTVGGRHAWDAGWEWEWEGGQALNMMEEEGMPMGC
jgi:hypothetical protein